MFNDCNNERKYDELSNQMENMHIHRNVKVHWAEDTIDNEFIKTEKSERCHKRKKKPVKYNNLNQE